MVAFASLIAIFAVTASAAPAHLAPRQNSSSTSIFAGKLHTMLGGCLGPANLGGANEPLIRLPCESAPRATFQDDKGELKFRGAFATVEAESADARVLISTEASPANLERFDLFGGGGVAPNPRFAQTIRLKGSNLCLDAGGEEVRLQACEKYREAQMVRFK